MRFLGIIGKLYEVGFDNFSQAGSTNKFHPMNIVAESRVLNLQFWICVDGGYREPETYHISERALDDYNAPTKRVDCKTQAEVIAGLEQIRLRIAEAVRLKNEAANLSTDKER